MDPSIMKLLEEDEDESMHSGADVDAFQAALNRDIGGDASTSQPPASGSSQENNDYRNQSFPGWQSTTKDENAIHPAPQDQGNVQHRECLISEKERKQHDSDSQQNDSAPEVNRHLLQQGQSQGDNQQGPNKRIPQNITQLTGIHKSENTSIPMNGPDRINAPENEPQYLKLQKMSNQQPMVHEQANNRPNRIKQVPFALLLPVILPQLDKDRGVQLQTLYAKLKKNEIAKDEFVRVMRGIVGDQMLKLAVTKLQQSGPHQPHMQGEAALQKHPRMQSAATAKFTEPHSFPQLHQKVNSEPSHNLSSTVHHREPSSSAPMQGLSRQQQHVQNMSMYGSGGSYHPLGGTNASNSASSIKSQPGGIGQPVGAPSVPKFERPNPTNDPKIMQSGSLSHFTGNVPLQQGSANWKSSINKDQTSGPLSSSPYVKHEQIDNNQQNKSHMHGLQGLPSFSAGQPEQKFPPLGTPKDSTVELQSPGMVLVNAASAGSLHSEPPPITSSEDPTAQVGPQLATSSGGINMRTPSKKPSVGQKKPIESVGSSPASSKKQKVSGAFADQSIEQLIDVTAVSGVNLREEEEQLFSGSKEDSRASEASRRFVQEEEETLILQRASLQKKLAEIMSKCGVKDMSNDVERCLSLCVEERIRGLLCNLIRVSKQRIDTEKLRHCTIITSDVRHQLTLLNQKARDEWEKKQVEAEKLQKLSEPEGNNSADGDKEKDEGRGKAVKVNKEEDDKMRTTAANVAARAAVGGDDMLSKWQMMAEQARQKREGGAERLSGSQPSKNLGPKTSSASGRSMKEPQGSGKWGQSAPPISSGATRRLGRNQSVPAQTKVARTISVKDVIAVLEREPQMSRSSLIYRLYNKVHSDTTSG